MILQCDHPHRHQLNSNGHLTINIFDLYLGGGGVLRTKGWLTVPIKVTGNDKEPFLRRFISHSFQRNNQSLTMKSINIIILNPVVDQFIPIKAASVSFRAIYYSNNIIEKLNFPIVFKRSLWNFSVPLSTRKVTIPQRIINCHEKNPCSPNWIHQCHSHCHWIPVPTDYKIKIMAINFIPRNIIITWVDFSPRPLF